MSNTIDSSNFIKTIVNDTQKSPSNNEQVNKQPDTSSANLADTISITDAAKKLASVEKLDISNMPINDNSKLDAIKQEIADGTYTIDSKAIADKMIEFE